MLESRGLAGEQVRGPPLHNNICDSYILCRLLEDLDDILLGALDTVCRDNQMASFPVSRGRNTEEYVLEKYPEVVSLIEEDRKRRIDSMRIRSRLNRIDASEGKPRMMSNEKAAVSPLAQRVKATPAKDSSTPASSSPLLKSRQSVGDLMFQMDDEYLLSPGESGKGKGVVREDKSPAANKHKPSFDSPALGSSLVDGDSFGGRSYLDDQMASSRDLAVPESPSETRAASLYKKRNGSLTPPDAQPPWSSSALSSSKKSLKDIMSEASETRVSNLSLGMGARRENNNATSKLSQKERKKIQQQQMQDMLAAQQKAKEGPQNPWKLPSTSSPAPVNEQQASPSEGSARSTPKPSMTLRQTVAGTPPPGTKPKTTPIQGQGRSTPNKVQTPSKPSLPVPSTAAPSTSNPSANPQPPIQSIRHIPRPEPYQTSFHTPSANSLSLATILMQQQTEKEELHEAATAKHNLEDIQLEQQFQEWWDKESRRVQGLPEPGSAPDTTAQEARDGRGNRGRGKGQGHQQRKRRGKGDGPNGTIDTSTPHSQSQSQPPPPSQPPRKDQRQQQQQKKTPFAPRREQQPQRPQANGNHPDTTSGSSRRGGRGAARGRGNRERGKVA